ncbi:unnamed protein product [Adineta ricciae]|uniref:G-protein coupled receptors family 1 profile domain-containing protein n=1 Tax=Adineta ricciae TaxID=249248 RepID=A0A815AHG7_ADIRI|nr:unnamed protein product [Adineta ricciae]CAF1623766.1 unnamed protein product [Adineta ricciae]
MSNTTEAINQLNTATTTIALILSLINFPPGAVGLIFNVLVFTRPVLNRQPCSFYFLISTLFNLFVVFIILPVRIVSNSFNLDLANYNLGICKTEFYSFYVVRVVSIWLILLACIDRYFHSSSNIKLRRLSSLKMARISSSVLTLLMIVIYSHMIVYFEIANVTSQTGQATQTCNARKGTYRSFSASWHMTLYSLCPSSLMLLFGILTVRNIHQHHRIIPTHSDNNQRHNRRTDMQLLRMLTIQVLFIIVSTMPSSAIRLYSSFTATTTKNAFQTAQENLATQLCNSLSYFAHSTSFYLYTLTGSLFRTELTKIIGRCFHFRSNFIETSGTGQNQMSLNPINQQRNTAVVVIDHQ